MIEGAFIFLVLVAVIAIAGVFFVVWVIASIARVIAGLCTSGRPRQIVSGGPQKCGNALCRSENPPHARFCRRCGQSLPMLMKILPATAAA